MKYKISIQCDLEIFGYYGVENVLAELAERPLLRDMASHELRVTRVDVIEPT